MTPINESAKGDTVQIWIRDDMRTLIQVTGEVVRVKKDGTRTIKASVYGEDRLFDATPQGGYDHE